MLTLSPITKNTGWGLKAIHDIKNGEFVIEYVGEVISKEMYDKRGKNCYVFTLQPGLYIDASLKGNKARFINHSCDPNLEAQIWLADGRKRVGFFAMRNISAGAELTFNYNCDSLQPCYCGTPTCVGFIGGKQKK